MWSSFSVLLTMIWWMTPMSFFFLMFSFLRCWWTKNKPFSSEARKIPKYRDRERLRCDVFFFFCERWFGEWELDRDEDLRAKNKLYSQSRDHISQNQYLKGTKLLKQNHQSTHLLFVLLRFRREWWCLCEFTVVDTLELPLSTFFIAFPFVVVVALAISFALDPSRLVSANVLSWAAATVLVFITIVDVEFWALGSCWVGEIIFASICWLISGRSFFRSSSRFSRIEFRIFSISSSDF